ncbi:MAG: transposase, partial [Candidatus Paracaedibacteraceae bacterium]|nr:transposase [Candidatus Paracaedibacteraceae bacterium]
GRKRHILVDTLGFVLCLIVLPAGISDRKGAFYLLGGKQFFLSHLDYIYADGGYEGEEFIGSIKQQTGWTLKIVKRTNKRGFKPLAKRWIVERTFAWINKYRRLSKDYELRVQTSEDLIYLAMIRLMLRRIT